MALVVTANTPDALLLAFEGRVQSDSSHPKNDELEKLVGADCFSRKVLLNLEKADYIDSSGIGWLIHNFKRFRENGGNLVLHSVPPQVMDVFKLLKLHTMLVIAADETAARAMLTTGGRP